MTHPTPSNNLNSLDEILAEIDNGWHGRELVIHQIKQLLLSVLPKKRNDMDAINAEHIDGWNAAISDMEERIKNL